MILLKRMNRFDKLEFNTEGFRDGEALIGHFRVDGQRVTAVVDDWALTLIVEAGKEVRLPASNSLNIVFQLQSEMSNESLQEILSNYCCRLEL